MTSTDLIWRLIEIIFKDKESNENAKEQEKSKKNKININLRSKKLPLFASFFNRVEDNS